MSAHLDGDRRVRWVCVVERELNQAGAVVRVHPFAESHPAFCTVHVTARRGGAIRVKGVFGDLGLLTGDEIARLPAVQAARRFAGRHVLRFLARPGALPEWRFQW